MVGRARRDAGVDARHLVTLAQAAEIGPLTVAQIRRKIRDGALLVDVHYTQPHRSQPLIVREAYLAWLNGHDDHLRKPVKARRSRLDPNWVNWNIASGM